VSEHAARAARDRHDVRARTSDFGDAAFDIVTLLDVIEHVRDPLGLLGEARRLLRPGGRIALTTPDLSSLSARLLKSRWPYVLPEHVIYFDRGTIRRALRQAGLTPVRVGPLRKSLRAEYVASVLSKRGDAVGRLGSRVLRALGGAEIGMMSGDLCALALRAA
jgi:SAM-dependent methyltransferase